MSLSIVTTIIRHHQIYTLFISIINNKDNSLFTRFIQLLFSRARPFLYIVLFISCVFSYM